MFVIPGILVLVRTSVAVPATMLENVSARQAISRSVTLTKGDGGRIFLMFLLVSLLDMLAIVTFKFALAIALGMAAPSGQTPFWPVVLNYLGTFLATVLVVPVGTIVFSLVYYDLRVRKEAFDFQHQIEP